MEIENKVFVFVKAEFDNNINIVKETIVEKGGIIKKTITKATNYVVQGETYSSLFEKMQGEASPLTESEKALSKARKLQADGALEIIELKELKLALYGSDGNGIFYDGEVLKEYQGKEKVVNIPPYIRFIGKKSFYSNKDIEEVSLSDNIEVIGENAFRNCENLKRIRLPQSLRKIENEAFVGCDSLQEIAVELPEGLLEIGDRALPSEIYELIIPRECIHVGECAIYGRCRKIYYDGLKLPFDEKAFRPYGWKKDLKKWIDNELIIYAPNVMLDDVPSSLKKSVVRGFTESNFYNDREINQKSKEQYIKYLKRQSKLFTYDAIKNINLRRLMLSEEIFKEDDIDLLIESENDTALKIELIEYKNNKFGIGNKKSEFIIKETDYSNLTTAEAKELWSYLKKEDGTIELKGYKGSESLIIVPETISGKIVTSIGMSCFSPDPRKYVTKGKNLVEQRVHISHEQVCIRTSFEQIVLTDNIIEIGEQAFAGCIGLKDIEIPDSVRTIGARAFKNCRAIRNVILPSKLEKICANTFENCESLKEIKLPTNLKIIDTDAFFCSGLERVVVENNVTKVCHGALSYCHGLNEVIIEPRTTKLVIEAYSFTKEYEKLDFIIKESTNIELVGDIFCLNIYPGNKKTITIHTAKDSVGKEYADSYGFNFVELNN